jgi:hypothetical protein
MRRMYVGVVICLLCVWGSLGCSYLGQPYSSLGLFPGPSVSQLTGILAGSTALGGLSGLTGLTGLTGLGSSTTGTSGSCPSGQTWIGTVNLNGSSVSVNSCVPTNLASQYGV